jgi:outer membrane biosynthesis protein TonB
LVTNKEELNVWSPVANTFIAVTSPVIKNYTANQKQIDAQTVQPSSSDLAFQVTYTPAPVEPTKPTEPTKPVQPTKPTEPVKPVQPTKSTEPVKPVQPTKPTEPTEPVESTKTTKPTQPVEPTHTQLVQKNSEIKSSNLVLPAKATNKATKKTEENILPQTGAKQNDTSLIGLAFGATSFLIGLLGNELKRKKKN